MSKFAVIFSVLAVMIAAALAWGSDDEYTLKLKTATIITQQGDFNKSSMLPSKAPRGGNFYIIQFDGPIREEWKKDLEKEGVRFYSYIPEYAFLAKLDPEENASIIFKPHVRFVCEYKPEYRLAPELERKITQRLVSPLAFASGDSIFSANVKVFDGEPLKPIISAIEQLGGKVKVLSNGDGLNEKLLEADVPFYRVSAIPDIPGVEWVESSPRFRYCMDNVRVITNASIANSLPNPLDGRGEILGIVDSGLDTGNLSNIHPAFAGNVAGGRKIVGARSFRSDHEWRDDMGHGTLVAGAMTGKFCADDSPAPLSGFYHYGMAPNARLYVQSGQTFDTYMLTPPLDRIVFRDAMSKGVRIHNNSYITIDSTSGEYNIESQQVDTFTWNNRGFLPVFSVGNLAKDKFNNYSTGDSLSKTQPDGVPDMGSIYPPSTAKNALSVGATDTPRTATNFDNTTSYFSPRSPLFGNGGPLDTNPGAVYKYSGRGPTGDGRIKPDIVAPGSVVMSTLSQFPNPLGYYYAEANFGTSIASGVAAGGAALIRQYFREMRGVIPTAALIKAAIINGAMDIGTDNANSLEPFARPDFHQGWGRLDVMGSVYPGQRSGDPTSAPTSFLAFKDCYGIITGQGLSYHYKIKYAGPVRVTLVWNDAPAAVGAAKQLVNDLDLTVISPEGIPYTSKFRNTDNPNLPWYKDPLWDKYDNVNNVESVEFLAVIPGDFYVNVQGTNVPMKKQPFAVVVTGGLDMDDTHSISGKVIHQVGTAWVADPGVTVTATGPVLATTTTAGDGSFILGTNLTPGNYYLNVYDALSTPSSKQPNLKVAIGAKNRTSLVLKATNP